MMEPQKHEPRKDEPQKENATNIVETHHQGTIFAWFETGLEGFVWALQEDGKEGYDGLVVLERGDYAVITAPSGDVVFDGIIEPDTQTGWTPRYPGASHGQPVAGGMWIHWTQKGWQPEAWMELFRNEDHSIQLVKTKSAD